MWSTTGILVSLSVSASAVTLLGDGELDTLALWQRDPRLLATDDKDVAFTRGELVVNGILDVHNVETSVVAFTVGDDTDTTHVTTTSGHGNDTSVETDEVVDFAYVPRQNFAHMRPSAEALLTSLEVDLDSVVDLDRRVWVSDTIMSPSALLGWIYQSFGTTE